MEKKVSKRKSLSYGEGRACRSHDDVQNLYETEKRYKSSKRKSWQIIKPVLIDRYRLSLTIHNIFISNQNKKIILKWTENYYGFKEKNELLKEFETATKLTNEEIEYALLVNGNLFKKLQGQI